MSLSSSSSNHALSGLTEGVNGTITAQHVGAGAPRRSPLPDQEASRISSPPTSSSSVPNDSTFTRASLSDRQRVASGGQEASAAGDSRGSQERIPLPSQLGPSAVVDPRPFHSPIRSTLAPHEPPNQDQLMVYEQPSPTENDLLLWVPHDHETIQPQRCVAKAPHSAAGRLHEVNSHMEMIRYEMGGSDDILVPDFDSTHAMSTGSGSPPFDLRQRALSEPEVRDIGQHHRLSLLPNVLRQRKRSGGGSNKGSTGSNIAEAAVPMPHQHPLRSRAFTTESTSRGSAQSNAPSDRTFDSFRPHLTSVGSGSVMSRSQSNNSLTHATSQTLPTMISSPLMSTPLDATLLDHLLPLAGLDDSPVPASIAVSDSDGDVVSRGDTNRYAQYHDSGSAPLRMSPPSSVNIGRPPRAPLSQQISLHDPSALQTSSRPSDARTAAVRTSRHPSTAAEVDRERLARMRWIRINRRFQLVISFVAILFSVILFAILVCWVFLTSAYVTSFDATCDFRLKWYYWLVTLQLVLDVFRSDIMRFVFRWDARSNERIPGRVVAYNIVYLIYAMLVLRRGIKSVFYAEETSGEDTCRSTAPDLFKACTVFVSLSIAAWSVIILGYLVPFCVVAAMLTLNGYNPNSATLVNEVGGSTTTSGTVFPAAYATTGAPPGCVDQLTVLPPLDSPDDSYPGECCICMENFRPQDVVVETVCRHMFHKSCCREWLRQARTCPVCRDDIPSACEGSAVRNNDLADHSLTNESGLSALHIGSTEPTSIPIGPSGRPVAGLLRVLRRVANRLFHETNGTMGANNATPVGTSAAGATVTTPSLRIPTDVEAGRR